MASNELDNTLGLTQRQVDALERLIALGAEPAMSNEEGKMQWHSDPKIRALQMIYEGRLGGPREGSGRKPKQRAAEVLADEIRQRTDKMSRALDRALAKKAGPRTNLDAVKLMIEIERGERKLQLEEEDHDGNVGTAREELIATLFELVQNPEIARTLEGEASEITDAEVISENGSVSKSTEVIGPVGREANSAGAQQNGHNGRNADEDGREPSARNGSENKNPLRKAALRRAANR